MTQHKTVNFDVAGKKATPIQIQIGPTPGYAFAVYKDNKAYHGTTREDWTKCATNALEMLAALEGWAIKRVRNEHDRPYNVLMEYSA